MLDKLKNIKITKNEIIMLVLIFIIIIIGLYNGTFAFFSSQKDTKISVSSKDTFENTKVIKSNVILEGELSHTTDKTKGLNTSNTISIQLEDVTEYDYKVTLATQIDPHNTNFLETVGSSIKYEVYHKTDTTIDTSTLTCESKKYIIGENEDYCQTGTFENKLDGTPFDIMTNYRISDTNIHYFDVYIYLSSESIGTSKLKTSFFFLTTPTRKLGDIYVQDLLAGNDPDLTTGLIPVVYDDKKGEDTHWFVADTSTAWYDYEEQWWANAISVDSVTEGVRSKYVNTDGTYNTGVEIATSDMLAMFVWIPRYSYTIGCTSSSSCLGYKVEGASDLSKSTPGAIDIKFVSKDTSEDPGIANKTYPTYRYTSEADRNPTNYYTHPAFNFGSDKLSGIWVGKFETSVNPNSTCYSNLSSKSSSDAETNCVASKEDVTPRILPNVLSLVKQTIYNEFETAKKFASNTMYGLTNKTDSHMMKNSEWGAVVYLSQSIYGKYGNSNYTEKNKEIYKNDSGTTDSWSRYTGRSQGLAPATSSYSDEGTYKYDDISTTDGTKVANSGKGASTTGNIYGIYDMVCGAYEYVMGNYGTETNGVFTGTPGKSEIIFSDIDIKYYDKFTTTSPSIKKSIETIGQVYVETAGWYSDDKGTLSDSNPWVTRGGSFNDSSDAGVFYSKYSSGNVSEYSSFRSVLVTIE